MVTSSESSPPELNLADPQLIANPFAAYGQVREVSPLARTEIPGLGPLWVLTRHEAARAVLADPRFEMNANSFLRPEVPEHCRAYMRTMSEMEGVEHKRLRRLVTPAFSVRRAEKFRARIEPIVHNLLDALPAEVDLLEHFARPLPMDVICELVGIPEENRLDWRRYGSAIAAGHGKDFAEALPAIIEDAKTAVALRREKPADDVLADLIHAEGDEKLTDTELVTLVWHLVLAGQTPTNLIANAVAALLTHPEQREILKADPALMPQAVEELIRWSGPTLLTIPRYAREDVEIEGVLIREGEAITASVAAANRDPRVYPDPDRLDITRTPVQHLGFGHGPHFCLGAAVARVQTEVALGTLLTRFPELKMTEELRAPDPGTWRLTALPVILR